VLAQHARARRLADRATNRISRPGSKKASMPSHLSEMTGAPHAAASKSRTEGDHPALRMSARVRFSCQSALA
jgi:hypothetical protein